MILGEGRFEEVNLESYFCTMLARGYSRYYLKVEQNLFFLDEARRILNLMEQPAEYGERRLNVADATTCFSTIESEGLALEIEIMRAEHKRRFSSFDGDGEEELMYADLFDKMMEIQTVEGSGLKTHSVKRILNL